ncbi:MAG: hypothetical protein WD355_12900 [Balneolaceae bacterium]
MQITAGTLLVLGMAFYISFPYSSQAQKTAFAEWLNESIISGESDNESVIRDQLRRLPYQSESFDSFLHQASLLISSNKTDFGLPVDSDSTEPKEFGQWLYTQWTLQQDSATSGAVVPDTIQPTPKWHFQHQPTPANSTKFIRDLIQSYSNLLPDVFVYVIQKLPIPFLNGSAINAP